MYKWSKKYIPNKNGTNLFLLKEPSFYKQIWLAQGVTHAKMYQNSLDSVLCINFMHLLQASLFYKKVRLVHTTSETQITSSSFLQSIIRKLEASTSIKG